MTNELANMIEDKVLDAFIKEGTTEFEVNNDVITIMLSTSGVHVWCNKGCTVICDISPADLKADRKRAADKVFKAIIEAVDGRIHCCDCGKVMKKSEIAGSYFAGVYCQHCWDTKWKAIEAAETYD